MGRVAVREAVTAYFQGVGLPYVGTVYASRPTRAQGADYTRTMEGLVVVSDNGSSAIVVINLPADDRSRIALTGRGAVNDFLKVTVTLEIFLINSSGDAIATVDDYDTLIDQIVTSIRDDPTLNAPTVIWSAGEYPKPTPIRHRQDEPRATGKGLQMLVQGTVEFEAWQQLVGENPQT